MSASSPTALIFSDTSRRHRPLHEQVYPVEHLLLPGVHGLLGRRAIGEGDGRARHLQRNPRLCPLFPLLHLIARQNPFLFLRQSLTARPRPKHLLRKIVSGTRTASAEAALASDEPAKLKRMTRARRGTIDETILNLWSATDTNARLAKSRMQE